jgi:hypothetical protein
MNERTKLYALLLLNMCLSGILIGIGMTLYLGV